MSKLLFLLLTVIFTSLSLSAQAPEVTEGRLFATDKQGPLGFCPLKSTKVRANISGFFARVTVVQEFENSYGDPIEAVYTFPLSQNSAVDDMTMKIGDRTIRGKIMKREEARRVYEAAKSAGQAASLLDQQRPNIFTQSVANIMPGEKVIVEISYVETLKFEDGQYEFVFPMVVGPRYVPASMKSSEAAKITPPIVRRDGHDISIDVNLDAGVPIELVRSISHEIETTSLGAEKRKIELKNLTTIPNKDFILRYDVTGKRIEDAVLIHRGAKGGFFTMMLQPPDSFAPKDVTPKEIVFVLDTSGSMSGFPIEKAKEAMKLSLDGLYPQDTFNLITFAGDTAVLFPTPVRATAENLARARDFLASRKGGGGTEMMKAITAALAPSESQKHMRIVCFMTDGYVSNEAAIIAEIQKYPNARIFSFGIGQSVNRFLLDKMASEGRGEVEYVSLRDDGSEAARRFHERIRSPLLTDISVDWGRFGVSDVYPGRQADLFSAKPVALTGRFTKTGAGNITLKGKMAGLDYQRDIPVNFPESETENDALATIWARARVDELMSKYYGAKSALEKKELEAEITQIGLEFRLMTQFTSFVAVEEKIVNQDGKMVKVEVPVQLAEGTFGSGTGDGSGTGIGSGSGSGSGNSTNAHGYIMQSWTGSRQPGSAEVSNKPANVTGLAVTVPRAAPEAAPESRSFGNLTVDGASDPGVVGVVLARLSTHQRALASLRSDIRVTSVKTGVDETEVRDGKLINLTGGAAGSSTRIDWKNPEENLSVAAGTFTVYQPKLAQVTVGKTGDEIAKAVLAVLNLGRADLRLSFDITYTGIEEVSPGIRTWHLELTRKGTNLKPVHIWVDKDGMIVQGKFTEQNDNSVTVLLTKPEKNVTLQSDDFKIVYPKETKVIRAGEAVTN